MFKKKLGFLLGIMVCLSIAGAVACLLAGGTKQIKEKEEFLLVTSFYPMYVLAENLTNGMEGMKVSNLTENQTGCLHDYQLTPRDMKLLSGADAFLINGAGMELFAEKVIENYSELPVIDASHGISLLEGVGHIHGEEAFAEREHDQEAESEAEHDHEAEHLHAENGHVWMDVERYRQQLTTVNGWLKELVPEKAQALEAVAAVYDARLQTLSEEVQALQKETRGMPVVIFHEAFAYLADSLGMEVLHSLSLDEDVVPSAGELAEVMEEIKYHGGAFLWMEPDYAEYAEKILAETGAKVVYLNPLTTGNGSPDSYVNDMRSNLEAIRGSLESENNNVK